MRRQKKPLGKCRTFVQEEEEEVPPPWARKEKKKSLSLLSPRVQKLDVWRSHAQTQQLLRIVALFFFFSFSSVGRWTLSLSLSLLDWLSDKKKKKKKKKGGL